MDRKGWITRVCEAIRQFFCIHDDTLSRDGNTISLQCMKCLRKTAGWHVEQKAVRKCA